MKSKNILGAAVLGAGAAVGVGVGIAKGVKKNIEKSIKPDPVFGLICPMEEETAPFREAMAIRKKHKISGLTFYEGTLCGQNIVLVQCGVGKVNAAVCAEALCSHFAIDYLINVGVAGASGAGVKQGDIVLSEDAVQHDMDVMIRGFAPGEIPDIDITFFQADEGLIRLAKRAFDIEDEAEMDGATLHIGRIASGDQFIAGGERAAYIQKTFAPLAVEMEGAAVAQAAWLNDIPFLIIRAMSDSADENAPTVDYPEFLPLAIVHTFTLVKRMLILAGEDAKAAESVEIPIDFADEAPDSAEQPETDENTSADHPEPENSEA